METLQNTNEYKRLLKHIKLPKQFVLIIAEYNDPLYRDRIIRQMQSDKYNCSVINLSKSVNPNISDFENELEKSAGFDVVHLINIHERENDEEFIKYLKGLNLHRDRIAQIAPVNIVLWFLQYQTPQLITEAIDFWNWNSGVVSFILKKEHFLGLPFSDIEIFDLNLQEKQENLESTINFLSNRKLEDFKSADYLLLEQLIRARFDIDAYEKKYNFLGEKLSKIRENILMLIEKFSNFKPIFTIYHHEYFIYKLYKKLNENTVVNKKDFFILLNKISINSPQSRNINYINITELKDFKKKEEYIFNLIYKLLDFKNLNKEEKKYLRYFSILPSFKIKLSDLIIYFGIEDNVNDFEKILEILADKGWLFKYDNDVYLMHPLIQTFIRQKLKPNAKNCKELIEKFADLLEYEPHENPFSKMNLLPLIENLIQFINIDEKNYARLLNNLSGFLVIKGDYSKALEYQLLSVNLSEKLLEDSHLNLSTAYSNLGSIYRNLGDYKKALDYQLKDLEIIEKSNVMQNPELTIAYSNIAETYRNLKNYPKVIEFQKKAIDLGEKIFDDNHPLLATYYGNIAETFRNIKDFQKSLEFHRKAIDIRERVLDINHPDLSSSYNNIGLTFQNIGNFEQALKYQIKSINLKENILGLFHPDLAISYLNIAVTYYYIGDIHKASHYINKSIMILKKSFPKDHPSFLNCLEWKKTIDEALGLIS